MLVPNRDEVPPLHAKIPRSGTPTLLERTIRRGTGPCPARRRATGGIPPAVEITIPKLIAAVLAIASVVGVAVSLGSVTWDLAPVAIGSFAALVLIWIPDEIGDATGFVIRGGYVGSASPGVFIAGFGWLALVAVPIAFFWVRNSQ